MNTEQIRLQESRAKKIPWKKWGPYLSERQWGTVREDYSENGDAWNYFPHDHARSRAYRWGEDGIAGISDDKQLLCFALSMWNGRDPILKERMFGLTNSEGNHGEDVKEYYFYIDSTPTHSYMKYLYKYPQQAYPYDDIVTTNRLRGRHEPEYELLDTGIFNDNRYFDVFVEYVKDSAEDLLIRITIFNRGPEDATLHLLPTLWFRNCWHDNPAESVPIIKQINLNQQCGLALASHNSLGEYFFIAEGVKELLFTNNETNTERLVGVPNVNPYVKDGINNAIVLGQQNVLNPDKTGTKMAAYYPVNIETGRSKTIRLRLTKEVGENKTAAMSNPTGRMGDRFDEIFSQRLKEADDFYAEIIPSSLGPDGTRVMRQSLAGLLWTKQFFNYDVDKWASGHAGYFNSSGVVNKRNAQWRHMICADIISMPDKWEYPWFAAWDLAFHVVSLMLVDEEFGKDQLELMLSTEYQHPNGQMPAYEWNFGDVNPPVHAWSTIFSYFLEEAKQGKGDQEWLERSFHKLLLNFNWWVNRKDQDGKNVFEGGFLGLDNIGVFDRSAPLPTGGHLEQADGTAWMLLFCQNMVEISMQLAQTRPAYASITEKLMKHFFWIASSMIGKDEDGGMWDEQDGFFYDVLRTPDGGGQRLKVRSMVGLLPLCAVSVFEKDAMQKFPEIQKDMRKFVAGRPELTAFIHNSYKPGYNGRYLATVLNETNLRRVLTIMLDEKEFLSPHGIRAVSRIHAEHPFVFRAGQQEYSVNYLPGESDTNMFGGNSNWRGPVWMPVNMIIIRALLNYFMYYGNEFQIECPTGSGKMMNLWQVAEELSRRLSNIFLRDESGRRPVYGNAQKFQDDPFWKDYILFYEYYHGDNGSGIGASHQTGWSASISQTMHWFATGSAEDALKLDKEFFLASGSMKPPAEKKVSVKTI
jgi:hypothetical protein